MKQVVRLFICGLVVGTLGAALLSERAWAEDRTASEVSSLTEKEVGQTMRAAEQKLSSLPLDKDHRANSIQKMLKFLQQRPEVALVAVNENGTAIWVKFKNKKIHILFIESNR